MDSSLPDPLPPGYRICDRYLVDVELPPQRMGRVYKAEDTNLHEVVAINVLSATLRDQLGIRRFRHCFRRARQLHPGQAYDYGEWLGVPFVVVQYIEGAGGAVDIGEL